MPRRIRIRRFLLVDHPFDMAHGEATESFKIKRLSIAKHFHHISAHLSHKQPVRKQAFYLESAQLTIQTICLLKAERQIRCPSGHLQPIGSLQHSGEKQILKNGSGFAHSAEQML